MTVLLRGSDLATVYAAAFAATANHDAAKRFAQPDIDVSEDARIQAVLAVRNFVALVGDLAGEPAHIGDPFLLGGDEVRRM